MNFRICSFFDNFCGPVENRKNAIPFHLSQSIFPVFRWLNTTKIVKEPICSMQRHICRALWPQIYAFCKINARTGGRPAVLPVFWARHIIRTFFRLVIRNLAPGALPILKTSVTLTFISYNFYHNKFYPACFFVTLSRSGSRERILANKWKSDLY